MLNFQVLFVQKHIYSLSQLKTVSAMYQSAVLLPPDYQGGISDAVSF